MVSDDKDQIIPSNTISYDAIIKPSQYDPFEARKDLPWFGTRHTVAVLGFLGISIVYAMRINLSVAIIAMVNNTEEVNNTVIVDACPYPDSFDPDDETSSTGEFDWDSKTQGLILGSFFYGYALTNLIGGRAAERFGGRLVVGLGIVFTAAFTVLSPLAARHSSGMFIAFRILEGITEGVTFPGISKMIADYYPQHERSKFTSAIFLGAHFGTVVTLIVSGILCDSSFLGGWPSVFYGFGALGLIWGIFWFWLVRDDPANHPYITKEELKYIMEGIPGAGKANERLVVPWKAIFTCKEFYATTAMHFGYNWGFYTLLTELPTYLDQILHFSLKSNGLLSAMPYLGTCVFGLIYSSFIDLIIVRGKISILFVRRLSMVIAGYGPALMLVVMCFVNCHSTWAIIVLVISGTMSGSHPCGFISSHADFSPRFAGTLFGLTNTFATIPGFLSPSITGAITQNNQTLWAWREVFIIGAIVMSCTTTIYILLIEVKVKEWNDPPELTEEQDSKQPPTSHDNEAFAYDEVRN